MNKSIIRSAVRGFYDLQKLRIQTGLRVVAAFKVQLGQEPSSSEDDLPDDAKKILAELRIYCQPDSISVSPGMSLIAVVGRGLNLLDAT